MLIKNIASVLIFTHLIVFFLIIRNLHGKIMSREIIEMLLFWALFFFSSIAISFSAEEVRFFKNAKLTFSFFSKNTPIPLDERLANKKIAYFIISLTLVLSLIVLCILYVTMD